MKSSFKMALPSLTVSTFLFLIVVYMSSCQSAGTKQPPSESPAIKPLPVAIINLNDSSGPQPILHIVAALPSGTKIQGTCRNCTDSSGNTVSSKILFSVTLNMDIPANTDIILQAVSK